MNTNVLEVPAASIFKVGVYCLHILKFQNYCIIQIWSVNCIIPVLLEDW